MKVQSRNMNSVTCVLCFIETYLFCCCKLVTVGYEELLFVLFTWFAVDSCTWMGVMEIVRGERFMFTA